MLSVELLKCAFAVVRTIEPARKQTNKTVNLNLCFLLNLYFFLQPDANVFIFVSRLLCRRRWKHYGVVLLLLFIPYSEWKQNNKLLYVGLHVAFKGAEISTYVFVFMTDSSAYTFLLQKKLICLFEGGANICSRPSCCALILQHVFAKRLRKALPHQTNTETDFKADLKRTFCYF